MNDYTIREINVIKGNNVTNYQNVTLHIPPSALYPVEEHLVTSINVQARTKQGYPFIKIH